MTVKKLIGALLCSACLLTLAANDAIARMKQYKGELTIVDAIPGGDEAIKNLAIAIGMENPELAIEIRRAKLDAALAELRDGKADLVLAYEELLPPDQRLRRRYAAEVALILVNAANPKKDYSVRELTSIFSGGLTDWSTLNGSGYSFHRLGAAPGAPGADVFQRKVLQKRQPAEAIYRKESADELMLLVATNPNTIAYLGMPNRDLGSAAVRDASVNGIAPDAANLASGKYPLMSFRAVVMGRKVKPAVVGFLQLLRCDAFSRLVKEEWMVPLP